jgi:hypothetical protein
MIFKLRNTYIDSKSISFISDIKGKTTQYHNLIENIYYFTVFIKGVSDGISYHSEVYDDLKHERETLIKNLNYMDLNK